MEVKNINGDIGVCVKDVKNNVSIGIALYAPGNWTFLTSIERDHVELLRDAINEYLEATK